jgi:hypothetical protein
LHHATNGTLGITGSAAIVNKNTAWQLFANRYNSVGYDLDKNIYGKTADPYHNYSFAIKLNQDFNEKNKPSVIRTLLHTKTIQQLSNLYRTNTRCSYRYKQ